MSQLDKLNFFPHLVWFFILFGFFYFLVFSYFLPAVFQSLKTRSLYFNSLLEEVFSFNIFFYFFSNLYNSFKFSKIITSFLSYLRQHKSISIISAVFAGKLLLEK